RSPSPRPPRARRRRHSSSRAHALVHAARLARAATRYGGTLMPLNPDAVGSKSEPGEKHWDSKDAILYALGVGCGVDDLPFTTENTHAVPQQVLPTMGVVLGVPGGGAWDSLGEINWTMLVHGEQAIEFHKPIPVEGTTRSVTTVAGVYDKGSGALVVTETESVDAATGEPLFTTRS